jgi:hypothetical protein
MGSSSALIDLIISSRWIPLDIYRIQSMDIQFPESLPIQTQWDKLPTEIILEILRDLSIFEVLSFSSSCRSFRYLFASPAFISSLLREQLHRPLSSMYWFMPVGTVEGEVEKFLQACKLPRLPDKEGNTELPSTESCDIFSLNFPLHDFVRRNYQTESMRNRRRLWRISQQFRREWYRYRTEGYDYNVFELGFIGRDHW